MKHITIAAAALLFAVACKQAEDKAIDTSAETTENTVTTAETKAPEMDSVAMMKAWESYMTPGEMHKLFASDTGTWEESNTMWMGPDDKNPTTTKMTAQNKMILGGRYLESRHSGNFMGQPFEGISTMAYDNASKKIVSTWVDNMGTGIMVLSGQYNDGTKTVELKGDVTDPMTGKVKPVRETYTFVDDNTRKMQMFDVTPDGKEYKSMEITMTRKK